MVVNIYLQVMSISQQAKLLNLSFFEYTFDCIKALAGFFPYQHQFTKEISSERNLSDLILKKKISNFSDLLGQYSNYVIDVDDQILDLFTRKLRMTNLWKTHTTTVNSEKKFLMSASLLNCSINYIAKFCNSFPFTSARLDTEDFNWELYIENSDRL